jgi:putative oxidoreductase
MPAGDAMFRLVSPRRWSDGQHQGDTAMSEEVIEPNRLLFPGLAKLYQSLSPYSYAIMRFSAGAVMVPHGVQKVMTASPEFYAKNIAAHGFPMPLLLAYLTFGTELIGAICLAVGLFTRVAAVAMLIEMTAIILIFNWEFGYFWTNRGVEYALLWWLLCLAIFFRGGGKYSLDYLIGKEI